MNASFPYARLTTGVTVVVVALFCTAGNTEGAFPGTALSFDGVSAYVDSGNSDTMKPLSALTVETWAYALDWGPPSVQRLVGCWHGGGYALQVDTNVVGGLAEINGAPRSVGVDPATLSSGWHHLAMTWDGRCLRFYLDGVLCDSLDVGASYDITYYSGNSVLLGADAGDASGPDGRYFSGMLDEVRIWTVTRTEEQIRGSLFGGLVGNEPGLVAYYRCDEGSGSTLQNAVAGAADGGLHGATTWTASGIPPATLWVDDDYADGQDNDGHAWQIDAFDTIQDAIDAAVSSQTVVVHDGVYTGEDNRNLDFGGKIIVLESQNGAATTTIACQGIDGEQRRAFWFHTLETSDARVEGFTIIGGQATDGGAIRCEGGASPTIVACVFEVNTSGVFGDLPGDRVPGNGGAIWCGPGTTVTIRDCTFQGNGAISGGGISETGRGGGMFCDGATVSVSGCSFVANRAGPGGGAIYCRSGMLDLSSCTFEENGAIEGHNNVHYGAGVQIEGDAIVTLDACDFADHTASIGGAVCSGTDAQIAAQGCQFTGNVAYMGGGAVAVGGEAFFLSCTFSDNRLGDAVGMGGAIYASYMAQMTGLPPEEPFEVTVEDCVLDGNLGGQGGGLYADSASHCPTVVGCEFSDNAAESGGGVLTATGSFLRTRFSRNRALTGGAVALHASVDYPDAGASFVNCLFAGNEAIETGGALANLYRDPVVFSAINCTFTQNSAGRKGGALSVVAEEHGSPEGFEGLVVNCILWGNRAAGTAGQIHVVRYDGVAAPSLVIGYSLLEKGLSDIRNEGGVSITSATHNLSLDPELAFPHTGQLMADSPCIDAGTDDESLLGGSLSATDIEDEPRVAGARVDIGADEYCGPYAGRLAVSAEHIEVYAGIPGLDPDPRQLWVRNAAAGTTMSWTVTGGEACSWLDVAPVSGVSTGGIDQILLSFRVAGLSPGEYTRSLVVTATGNAGGRDTVPAGDREVTVVLRIGATRWVAPTYADGQPNDGHTWGVDAFGTIQDAIDMALSGDTIILKDGHYAGIGNGDAQVSEKTVTIQSENGPDYTTIQTRYLGVRFMPGSDGSLLRGVTFVNSGAPHIRCEASSPTISDCVFQGTTSSNGDNSLLMFGTCRPRIERCSFTVRDGIYIQGAIPTIVDSLFSGTIQAIYLNGGLGAEIINCRFVDGVRPGDFVNRPASVKIEQRSWSEERVGVTIRNCTFLHGELGCIFVKGSGEAPVVRVENCSFVENSAPYTGWVDYSRAAVVTAVGGADCTVTNGLFWGNTVESPEPSEAELQTYADGASTVTLTHCGFSQAPPGHHYQKQEIAYIDSGTGWVITDHALFWDSPGDDFRLLPGSPFIDAGRRLNAVYSDQRGSLRPVDGDGDGHAEFDIGAFEYAGYYGGGNEDDATEAFRDLRVKASRILIGYEYQVAWGLRLPLPDSDPRFVQADAFDVRLLLDDGRGRRIELQTTRQELDRSGLGYTVPLTFAYEHLGTWYLRLELVDDPRQFVLSDDPFIIEHDMPEEVAVGNRILPPPGAVGGQQPDVEDEDLCFWSEYSETLYAVAPGVTAVTWYADEEREIPIPVLMGFGWHDVDDQDPLYRPSQTHIAGTPVVDLLPEGSAYNSVTLKYSSTSDILTGSDFEMSAPPGSDAYHSVLYYYHTETEIESVEVVRTVRWQTAQASDSAVIGEPIAAPPGHHASCGGGYVLNPTSRVDAYGEDRAYDRHTRSGPIIPVNESDSASEEDALVVVWYRAGVSGARWPCLPIRYACRWPEVGEGLRILAIETRYPSGGETTDPVDGSGPLPAAVYGSPGKMRVYHQPDPDKAGYNPNEEHALLAASFMPGVTDPVLYVLRNDLNRPRDTAAQYGAGDTSKPYVLLKYEDPVDGGWSFQVYRVAVSVPFEPPAPGTLPFSRHGTSGEALTLPYPLPSLSALPCEENTVTAESGPAWEDKFGVWYGREPIAESPVVLNLWYPLRDGMWYDPDGDGQADAQPGDCISWDIVYDGEGTSRAVEVSYDLSWPVSAPVLYVGETLLAPKRGVLPDIDGQCSVDLIYNNEPGPELVRLLDPLTSRSVGLDALPAGVATMFVGTAVTCADLPAHLQKRVFFEQIPFDSAAGRFSFRGYLDDSLAGEPLLLPNIMSAADKALLLDLSDDPDFTAAVQALHVLTRTVLPTQAELSSAAADAKMISAGGAGDTGYVIVAFNNDSACAGPVQLQVIKVEAPLYAGEIKVIESDNVLDERVVLRHTGDCGGEPDSRLYEWEWCPDDGGRPDEPWQSWLAGAGAGEGAVEIVVQGTGDRTLADKWFRCRYRHDGPWGVGGDAWSEWTVPQLYQGWIKRVLAAINLFDQRVDDFHTSDVNTVASMIRQAGERYEGDVALSSDPETLQSMGLIPFYTTVLRRGVGLTVGAEHPVYTQSTHQQLMLVAGRLADLYMLLGNEAYADAVDPTIGFGTSDNQHGSMATSLFCFQNQLPSLLQEELALLRGVDSRGTRPFYNRLVWNVTQAEGEVAYVQNYQIQDKDHDGEIDEQDARVMYPQGHGDAWGHYLSVTGMYYDLLRNDHFDWVPRAEAVLVAGVPVTVDYVDERQFASAAAAKAKTGVEVVGLTYRAHYVEDPEQQWQGYKDSDADRAWGLAEWGQRVGQAAYFDWVTANAVLPVEDTDPTHTGVQKVDRTTVPQVRELAAVFRDVQAQMDSADAGLSPLGLAADVVPFDIDPQQIAQGQTHVEQIAERAIQALGNAVTVFDHANSDTQLLRRQADSIHDFQITVIEREVDFRNRLIEVFGSPYPDDIGGGGTYAAGYDGPDLYHYMLVDRSALTGAYENESATEAIDVAFRDYAVNQDGSLDETVLKTVTYHLSTEGFGIVKPASWSSERRSPGDLQMAQSDLLQGRGRFERALSDYDSLLAQIQDQSDILEAQYGLNSRELLILNQEMNAQQDFNDMIMGARQRQVLFRTLAGMAVLYADAFAEALPTSVGFSTDVSSPARSAIKLVGCALAKAMEFTADLQGLAELDAQFAKDMSQAQTNIDLVTVRGEFEALQQLKHLEQLIRQEVSLRYDLYVLQEALQQAQQRCLAALTRGLRLLEDRLRFRRRTAAHLQEMRYRDMAFRVFRNDALQKYRAQFDLAARYVYLAARAYDYETNLLDEDARGPGSEFLTQIVRSRALGLLQNGQPRVAGHQGDPGLCDPMARMMLNWTLVLDGQLGFNNPQTETNRFSLRRELYHLSSASADDEQWRQNLADCLHQDLLVEPAFRRYCRAFYPQQAQEPGLIIPFATHIEFGTNFFGLPLWGGDSTYDSTNFATKVRSVGVWFSNYNNLAQSGLAQTPRVYLVPIGQDRMRSPTGYSGETRSWTVVDQLIPVPFPITGGDLADPDWIPLYDSLTGDLAAIRRYASFRAYHDSGSFNPDEVARDSRLIGRSVWNTHWLLIIPAGTLHSDRDEAIRRFIYGLPMAGGPVTDDLGQARDGNGISDIRLFFQTYAYSGAKKGEETQETK